ncbi:hypothetical protein SCLCIDRAFT_1214561 [Scleroderma citrinum Foug A]|uniref:Uncharacterized protein n=1 Tax=Scleroderma citrinum Foug A TaxID=1036808 RepID=A0A0C3ADK4_9AGAM|nr:hypothetical protein SCLCIDRAFT_1214561 [Scleroderma citrinum Foug A]
MSEKLEGIERGKQWRVQLENNTFDVSLLRCHVIDSLVEPLSIVMGQQATERLDT